MTFRNCLRNHSLRREAFVQRARELLPHLANAIESAATARYGATAGNPASESFLHERLEKILRLYDWFAEGKPAGFTFYSEILPHGEIDRRFVRCWHEAIKATPTLSPSFVLRADGFRVPLPHGHYRFNRSVLLVDAIDDDSDVTVKVDEALLNKGGLYRVHISPAGVRLEALGASFARWKIALRMLRRYRRTVWPEIMRRLRAGGQFEFARGRGELHVTLRCGRMPKEVREDYQRRASLYRARLNRIDDAHVALASEGRAAAEAFAAQPAIIAAERAAEREEAITYYRAARDRLWEVALTSYHKSTLPDWPFRTPAEIRGRVKSSLSPRQRTRLDSALDAFAKSFETAAACGWNPLAETLPSATARATSAQQILAMEFA